MIGFRTSLFCCLVLACSVTSAGARQADIAARAKGKAPQESIQRQPMIFFVAKGGPNACGSGCSEWIAAEGLLDPNVAQRFLDFVGSLPRGDLPIFFNSKGGISKEAIVLGTLLRERRMTVRVGRTIPDGCHQSTAIDAVCRRLMQSKREHKARLVTAGAVCGSGCVDAFVGGSVRLVARDAQLAIHSLRVVPQGSEDVSTNADDIRRVLRIYFTEMGVDPALVDAATAISPDRFHFMTRDEIARFGIETRGSFETRWLTHPGLQLVTQHGLSDQFFALKSVTESVPPGGRDHRTRTLRIWCGEGGGPIGLVYQREPSFEESGRSVLIHVGAGSNELVLRKTNTASRFQRADAERVFGRLVEENGEAKAGSEQRSASVSWEFLRAAAAAPSIAITEWFASQGSGAASSRAVKFSTDGLSKALDQLQKNCGQAKVL